MFLFLKFKYNQAMIFSICFNAFRTLVGATSILFLMQKGLLLGDIALLKGFQAVIIVSIDVPLGYFADKYSRKLSVLLGSIMGSFYLFFTGISSSISIIYLGEFCNALSLAFFNGASSAIIIDLYKKEKKTNDLTNILKRLTRSNLAGMLVAVSLSAAIPVSKLNMLWLFSSVLMAFLTLCGLFLLTDSDEEGRSHQKKKSNHFSEYIKKEILTDISYLKSLIKHRIIIVIFSLSLLVIMFQIVINFNQVVLNRIFNNNDSSFYFSLLLIVSLLIQTISSNFISKKMLNYWVYILGGLFVIGVIIFVDITPILAILCLVLFYFVFSILGGSLNIILQEHISNNMRATVSSIISTIGRLLTFFGLGTIGLFKTNLQMVYLILLILYILLISLLVIYRSKSVLPTLRDQEDSRIDVSIDSE